MNRLADRILKYVFITIYSVVSIILFDEVYETSSEVIDELFHVGQGLQYCQGNFSAVSFVQCLHFCRKPRFQFSDRLFSGIPK